MPLYLFSNPKNPQEIVEVIQGMNEEHVYEVKGVKWSRVWTVPQAADNLKIDAFSQEAFVDKIGKTKGTFGSVLERSSELSAIRAEKRDGVDQVKEQYYKDYSKKRKNKEHYLQTKEKMEKATFTI